MNDKQRLRLEARARRQQLARLLPMTLSPASVRNVMQDLEELGLIYAPHASAGRLPTEFGLRFFVDAMLELGDVGQEERAQIEAQDSAFLRKLAARTQRRAVIENTP